MWRVWRLPRQCWLAPRLFPGARDSDVDTVYALLLQIGANIVHPPEDGLWAPGYYSVLFEDPGGIRLEVNHVPGKGLLEPDVTTGRTL